MLIEIKAGQFRKVSRLVRRECCNCMDGRIEVNEKESTLVIIFENVSCIATELPPEKILGRSPDYARINQVVLVDDVPMNLKVLSALLRRLGIQSRQASSGAEALHVLNEFTPQIILSDMWMPGMSGAQLAAEIRRKPQGGEILLVALTADTEANTTFSMHDFNAIILKPVTIEKLTKLLSRISAGKISRSPENDKPYLIQ